MCTVSCKPPGGDEELIDYLIAVSVIAKRMAERLRAQEKPPAEPRCVRGAEGAVKGG